MKLSEARLKAGFDNVAELSVKSKVSVSTINNIESGRNEREGITTRPATKRKLCKALKLNMEDLDV